METKTLALAQWKIAGDGAGTLEGIASPYGAVDSYGDTVLAGAYDDTLADFLKDGFLAVDHDWTERIGYPLSAVSTPEGLRTRFAFHSDADAQKHRTRTAERMAHGKGVGLSIGYQAERTKQRDDGVRVLERIRLYEVSIVGVPAEPLAQASSVKNDGAESAPETLIAALRDAAVELKEGRQLSATSRSRIRAWLEALAGLDAARADLEEWLEATEPVPKTASARLRFNTRRLLARLDREGLRA